MNTDSIYHQQKPCSKLPTSLFTFMIIIAVIIIPIIVVIYRYMIRSYYSSVVGGIPTPLKNHGVRQLGWWNSHIFWKVIKFHGSKPPTSYRYITDKNHREICILDFFLAPTKRDSDNGIAPPCRCHIRVTGIWVTTVDGRIPAPVNRWLIPWFIGFLSSQVVQVFPSSYHHYIRYIHVYPILTSCLITSFLVKSS